MTEHDSDAPIAAGLHAWMAGDLNALEAILDPQVTLRWVDPGPWDCTNREQLMRRLRQGAAERGGRAPYPVHVDRLDEHTVVVTSDAPIDPNGPQPFPVGTRVTVVDGKVVAMQQYRTDIAGP